MKKKYLIYGIITTTISILFVVFGLLIGNVWLKDKSGSFISTVLYILAAITLLISFSFYNRLFERLSTKQIVLISMMSAFSIILYYIPRWIPIFHLPFTPSWLDFQVSDIPAILTSFMYGPVSGVIIIVIRFIIKLPMTQTIGVGELADLILGISFVIVSGLIYKKNRTFKGALLGSLAGVLVATTVACLTNWLILIPAYINIAGFPESALISGMSYISNVDASNFMIYYIFVGVLPFNLIRYLAVLVITFVLYKHVHRLFDRYTMEA